jgi:hypothetical protein
MGTKLKTYSVFFAAMMTAQAQEQHVSGKVTYLSSGTVYTSMGWGTGIQDSTALYVVAGKDTLATLKVFAVSSKSCACAVVGRKKEIAVGDVVVGTFVNIEKRDTVLIVERDTIADRGVRSALPLPTDVKAEEKPFLAVQGRVSLQYYSAAFNNNAFNFTQPGLVLNLRATSSELPLKLDLYGNFRTLARGGASPFSANASNASRIYRFSIEYNDNLNDITVGRIIPSYAPSIGSIDGMSYSRRLGDLTAGASVGFQPTYNLQGISTDTKKIALFAQYQIHGGVDLAATGAYARTYHESFLDREAISLMFNAYTSGGLSAYGYGDFDLRVKNADQFAWSPSVSMMTFMVNYRFADFLTVGVGADASRAVFPFSSVQTIADTLLDRKLRSGATLSFNVTLMNGLGAYNAFTPRSNEGGFGQDYTNYSAFYLTDIFSSGATVRVTYMMNENEYTNSRGFGLNLQRDIFGVDCVVRYQQTHYKIYQLQQVNTGETFGADVMVLFTRRLSFVTSIDSMRGFGSNAFTIFSELSWRL